MCRSNVRKSISSCSIQVISALSGFPSDVTSGRVSRANVENMQVVGNLLQNLESIRSSQISSISSTSIPSSSRMNFEAKLISLSSRFSNTFVSNPSRSDEMPKSQINWLSNVLSAGAMITT